jgi:serine/threonine protein kinase/tetratricopeptide (TPR) repeat protein
MPAAVNRVANPKVDATMAGDSLFGSEPGKLRRLAALGFKGLNASTPDPSASTGARNPLEESPGDWIGPYKLLSILGEGGMGMVYLADQARPVKRLVALKIIKPGMDSKRVLARFEAEQQALALMDHPHVAHVYDAGLAPSGRPYFVMEHVKGLPLTEHCDKYRLTIEQRLQLFLHVCEAVQHAHQKGIIHRDIKPSNILVMIQDRETIPKVIDFGVARAMSQSSTERTLYTEQGQLIGTPEYMSPEQMDLDIHDIDTRTDIYSLGVLLYELLTGMLPFDRQIFREGGIEHLRKVICTRDPKTPSMRLSKTSLGETTPLAEKRRSEVRTLQRKLRGDLDWITLKALERDRTRRYASVDAMAADIRNYLNHRPVSAAPPGSLYRAGKFIRRHRQAAIVLPLAALFVLGSCFALLMYRRASTEYHYAQSLEHQRLLTNAQELARNRKFDEAMTDLDPLLNSPNVGRQARLLHAQILIDKDDPKAAASELESLCQESDDIAGQAHFLLAGIYYETDPWAPAKTREYVAKWENHSRQAERLIAGTAQYYFLQAEAESDVKRKLELYAKALTLDKEHYNSLRERAYIYYAQKDYRNMGRDAARMIGLQSGNAAGYLLSALASREQGHFEEAIADCNEAILLAPDNPVLYEQRGETYTRMGQYALALADAQRASALDPENLSRHVRVFMALVALGRYEQAQQQYESVINQPWARTEYSPWAWEDGSWDTKNWFGFFIDAYTNDALSLGQKWPSSVEQSGCIALQAARDASDYYARLGRHATRIVADAVTLTWSPDGTKIAYAYGAFMASAIAILDLKTGTTELLTMGGKDPAWSPDGRYIAYIRDRQRLSLDVFTAPADAMEMHRKSGRPDYAQIEEVWIIEPATHRTQRIDAGRWPAWSRDSMRLYYRSHAANALCSISIGKEHATPTVILEDSGAFPTISPDERYVANATFRQLDILDVPSKEPVITWIAPPFPCRGLLPYWRPDGLEIAVCGWHGTRMGFWILDTQTGQARRMIDGPVTAAQWSPDCSRMAIALGLPYWEIWLVDLDPNLPTAETFGDGRTEKQHCLELIESCNRSIAADPNYIDGHLCRTDAALWIEDSRAPQYLEELERVFRCTPCYTGGCNARAQAILSSPPILRDRLRPLALLLARMAAEKRGDLAGNCRYDQATDTYTISGIGADIWDTHDDFHFAYRTLHGDGSITARIDSLENVRDWTKAGVMIRDNLDPTSRNVMALITPTGVLAFQYRRAEANLSYTKYAPAQTARVPHWIRLTRRGNRFTAEHSPDGLEWENMLPESNGNQPPSLEIPMNETVYIGLAVTSHDTSHTAEARISDVTLTGSATPGGPFTDSQDIGGGKKG